MSEPVYQHYFGLAEAPFSITPDPRFVYLSPRHEDALAHLRYGIGQGGGGGFVQLTGEVGTGKTTLCRLLLEQLPDTARVALVLNPRLDPLELLETLCEELAIATRGARGSLKRLNDRLNAFLLDAHARGLTVVLVIDEAQLLSPESLEQVRLLTNLETPTQKLLQIVLLGQPELRDLLGRSDLRQLAQRITARYHLEPLDRAETAAYVRHRLQVAGCPRSPFSAGALAALYRHSGGVPRSINIIAERSLLAAYALDRRRIDPALVHQAAREVLDRPRRGPAAWRWAAAAGLVLAVSGLGWYIGARPGPPDPVSAVAAPVEAAAEPVVPAASTMQPQPLSTPAGEAETPPAPGPVPADPPAPERPPATEPFAAAWQRLLAARGLEPPAPGPSRSCPLRLAPALFCLEARGSLFQLRQLGRPVLVEMPALAPAYAVLEAGEDGLRLLAADGGAAVSAATLERHWNGRYWDVWTMPGYVPTLLREGDRGPGVLWVKTAAAAARPPFPDSETDPYFGPTLTRWVEAFQQHAGLEADGLIGPETLQFLSRYARGDTG